MNGHEPSYSRLKKENEQLKKQLQSLKEEKQHLKNVQEKFLHIFNHSSEAIFIHDMEGKMLEVNDVACKRMGYSREELMQMKPMDFDMPKDAKLAPDRIQEINKNGLLTFESLHKRKDGTFFPVEISSRKIKIDNKPYILSIARDISRRKEAESRRDEYQRHLSAALGTIDSMIIIVDRDLHVVLSNWKDHEWVPDEERTKRPYCYKVMKHFDKPCSYCPPLKTFKDGKPRWYEDKNPLDGSFKEISVIPIFDDHGKVEYVLENVKDVTKYKNIQEEISQREENLRITLNSIGDGVISTDLGGNVTRINPIAQNLTGWNEKDAIGQPLEKVFNIINAKTSKKADNPVNKVIETGNIVGLANHTLLISKNKEQYQIADSGAPIKDKNNNITGVVLVFRDVTEEYNKRQEIRESRNFLNAIFQSIQDGISVLNTDLSIRYVNPVMEKWYSEKKPLVGKKCYNCYHNTNIVCDPCPTLRCMKSGKTEYEIVKDLPGNKKNLIWFELYSYPIKDKETGEITGVVEFIRDITKRKQVEDELKKNEQQLKRAQSIAKVGSYTFNFNTGKVTASDEAYRIYGVEPGKEFTIAYTQKIPLPEYRPMMDKALQDLIKGINKYEIEFKIKRPIDGKMADIYSVAEYNHEENTLNGTIQDITERIQMEEALKKSEDRLSKTMMAANDGMWDWDLKTNDVYFDPRYYEMAGYETDEFPHNLEEFKKRMHPEDVNAVMKQAKKHINGEIERFIVEFRFKKKNNDYMWIMGRGIIVEHDIKGSPTRMVGTHTNITERKTAEEKILKQNEEYEALYEEYYSQNEELKKNITYIQEINIQLEEAKEKAEESDRLKTAFLANMSHEIRTPMNGIMGFTELLKSTELEGDKKDKYINLIQQSGNRMLNLINDLIDISKLEAGQVEITLGPTNINKQIEYLYTFFKPEANKKGLLLSYKMPLQNKDAVIKTDKEKLYIILANLIKNAIKYTHKGHVDFGYHLKEKELTFYVEDTGIGINKNKQKAIFDRFVQADLDIARPYEGAGLGLSISKAYVDLLGGKIQVKSTINKGSCFSFTLPYQPVEADDTPKKKIHKQSYNWQGKTILIVEDEPTSQEYLTEAFSATKAKILIAETGKSALSNFRKNKNINIILMDIRLPDVSGLDVIKEIRKSDKQIPVVAQTAQAMADDQQKCMLAGANDYLSKPINIDELQTSGF